MRRPGDTLYWIVVIVVMFVSFLANRSVVMRLGKPVVTTSVSAVSVTRSFLFSSRANVQTADAKAESGWTAAGESEPSLPGASTAASSTAYNYDQSSFDKLILYNVSVAFQPKNRKESNVFREKHKKSPAELLPSGEDNLFVSSQDKDGYLALGVADGVGGWSEAGYDSSAISRELCHQLKVKFEGANKDTATPKQLLRAAFDDVKSSPRVEIGGTTACLGILTPDKKLKVANIGDSWCGLFRDYRLIKETQFQTHNFNTPFQLAKIPAHILRQAELQGKRYIIDSPDMCDEYVWDLQKDDVVIFATDGVTDNIVPKDIELFLKDKLSKGKSLSEVSSLFVKDVEKVSKDTNFPSSFAQELSRITGQRYLGGKEDDITVVMIKVL